MKKAVTDDELIRLEFNRRFVLQELPTIPLSNDLESTPEVVRQEHYRKIAEILEDSSFQKEIADWKRRLMRQLAIGVVTVDGKTRDMTDLERQGWRQTLIEIEREMEVLTDRAMRKQVTKSLHPIAGKV